MPDKGMEMRESNSSAALSRVFVYVNARRVDVTQNCVHCRTCWNAGVPGPDE